jgi:Bromodomain
MNPEEHAKALSLVKYLCDQPESASFINPVDFRGLGLNDYPYVIKTPIDLSIISYRIKQNYYMSLDDFLSDLVLVLDNCRLYYHPDSKIVAQAEALEKSMVRFCNIHQISFDNAIKRFKIEENTDSVPFKDRIELSNILKTLTLKKLELIINVIETECPQAITNMKDNTLQLRLDALDRNSFYRIKEITSIEALNTDLAREPQSLGCKKQKKTEE